MRGPSDPRVRVMGVLCGNCIHGQVGATGQWEGPKHRWDYKVGRERRQEGDEERARVKTIYVSRKQSSHPDPYKTRHVSRDVVNSCS